MIKKGDTLIEVTLAIGIFSMVAVSIVAVMGNGTASAETALETTLAREEIDAQADALRFIHSAFISDENHEDDRYAKLWEAITKNANDNPEAVADYSPTTCDELYNKGDGASETILASQKAFVINTNYLGTYSNNDEIVDDEVNKTVVSYKNDASKFTTAKTYPHLIYQSTGQGKKLEDESALTEKYNNFVRAEGIYVVAVKDPGTVVPDSNDTFNEVSAFYDFYIRSCWYGIGDDFPTTISTVIRLYNPDAIVARKIERVGYMQDATFKDLDEMTSKNGKTTLKDRRDEKAYEITKINGQYWMTQNLRLTGGGGEKTLTPSDTNIATNYTMPPESEEHFDKESGYTNDGHKCSDNSATGCWYNFASASAKTIIKADNSDDAKEDICPKGWRLPTGPNTDDSTDFNNLIDNSTSGYQYGLDNAQGIKDFSPVVGGVYVDGSKSHEDRGLWWSATPDYKGSRFNLYYSNSSPGDHFAGDVSHGTYRGYFVRCVFYGSSPQPQPDPEPQPEPEPEPEPQPDKYMQDATPSSLKRVMPNHGNTWFLYDRRDNTRYRIRKINGQYWMTESLKLSSAKLKKTTLSKDDTNTTIDFKMPTPCGGYCTFDNISIYYNKAYYDCGFNDGCHYNYAAASAGTITGENNTIKASNDICPKGWRLPTGGEARQVTPYTSYFAPNKGGIWQNGSRNLTGRGDWWTSDAYNSKTRYYLNYNANNNGKLTVGTWDENRFLAIFVRCVKK